MAELGFILRHGAVVWQVAAAGFVAAGLLAPRLLLRRVRREALPPSERPGEHREAAARWASGQGEPVAVVAERGEELAGPGLPTRLAAMLLAVLAFLALFGGGGMIAAKLDAEVAAATPFHRDQGLRAAQRRLAKALADDPSAVVPFLEVSSLLEDEVGALFVLLQHGYLEEAEPLARSVGTYRHLMPLAEAWAMRGNLGRASDLAEAAMRQVVERPEPVFGFALTYDVTPVHILAWRFDRAAAAMAQAVEIDAGAPLSDDAQDRAREVESRAKRRCYAAYVAHLAGDTLASGRLEDRTGGEARVYCTHLWQLTLPPQERAEAIVGDDLGDSEVPPSLRTLLAYEGLDCAATGEDPRCASVGRQFHDEVLRKLEARDLLLEPWTWIGRTHPGVDQRVHERLEKLAAPQPHQRLVRATLATSLGVLHAITGDRPGAQRFLDGATDDRRVLLEAAPAPEEGADEPDEPVAEPEPIDHALQLDELASLQAMIALATRDWEGARRHLASRRQPAPALLAFVDVMDPRAPLPEDLSPVLSGIRPDRRPVVEAALRGKGGLDGSTWVPHHERILLATRAGHLVPDAPIDWKVRALRPTLTNAVPVLQRATLRGDAEQKQPPATILGVLRTAALDPHVTEASMVMP